MTIKLSVEKKALELVKPRREDYERVNSVYRLIESILVNALAENSIEAKVKLEGSVAKDTWIKTEPELDVFVILPKSYTKNDVKSRIVPLIKNTLSSFNPILNYAEHPYVTIEVNGVKADIVPAIERGVNEPVKTAVDRTPLHTEYVRSRTNEKLRDEIRLLKKFAKTIGVYGAEIKTEGFSGYLLELLAIHYGGFRETLEAAANWKPPVIIDAEGYYSSNKEILDKFGKKHLIVIDPTDKNRNVAAAVSLRRMSEFSLACKLYLKKPCIYYFTGWSPSEREKERILKLLEQYYSNTIVLEAKLSKKLPPDTIWGEGKRALRNMSKKLEENGFRVVRCDLWCNDKDYIAIACILEEPLLSSYKLQYGPPCYSREHSIRFIEKYMYTPGAGPWVTSDGRLACYRERREYSPIDIVEKEVKSILVSDLAESIYKAYMLSWKPEAVFNSLYKDMLFELLWGKPKWLIPYIACSMEE